MTRREEFMASRTRDPSIVKMKIGVKVNWKKPPSPGANEPPQKS
jgi:hypothetical protein